MLLPWPNASRRFRLAGLPAAGILFVACAGQDVPPSPSAGSKDSEPFADVTRESGLDFVHENGMRGELWLVEMMGPGGGFLDYDGDGDLDVYLVQGGPLDEADTRAPLQNRLFRNDLQLGADGRSEPRFTDVTAEAGVGDPGYGMGVATGDYDNDGDVDLYVTNFGPNVLYRNEGDGRFTDVTRETGTGDARFSVPAVFFDYDRDGRLDLYVGNYVDFRLTNHRPCRVASGRADYCGPLSYDPEPDRLFHNEGDGRFRDVTNPAGLRDVFGNALGAMPADYDRDGWVDLYVANDAVENALLQNQGDRTFRDVAMVMGCAVNADGQPEGSMGVDAGDIDGDGDDDLFMTHMGNETNTLYLNDGRGGFRDGSIPSGMAEPSRTYTGFGMVWLDYDNDGWLDAAMVNGAVKSIEAQLEAGEPLPLRQRNQLLRNLGGGRFEEVEGAPGAPFGIEEVGRGLAVGDVDNDGDPDLLVVNNQGPARLLRNTVGQDRPWIGLRLVDGEGRSDVIGARAILVLEDGSALHRSVRTAGSYASAQDPRILFGLGGGKRPGRLEVVWPGGEVESWPVPPAGRYTTLRRGSGTVGAP